MSRAERSLVWLLRFEAIVLLFALPAVILPTSWMDTVHRALGMGELPRGPLVEYLTRSASLLYATYAPVLYVSSTDIPRYLPLIQSMAWVKLIFGLALLVLDLAVGMPLIWIVLEGPVVVVLSALTLVLARQIPSQGERP